MEAALRAAGEPETWCLFRPRGIVVIVFFFRTIRFMAPSSEAAYWKDVNLKNVVVSTAVKIGRSRLWISMKVRLSVCQTTLFWFSRSLLSSLLMQADNIPALINYAARQSFASRGQTFASLVFFFSLSWIRSQNTSPVEKEKQKTKQLNFLNEDQHNAAIL